jgi:glutaminase
MVNSESLSIMAATLANGGICPKTNQKIFLPETVRCVLSMMQTCGMFTYSGRFSFEVGHSVTLKLSPREQILLKGFRIARVST